MFTLYRIDYMDEVPNYDDDPTTYYLEAKDTYYIWVPTEEEDQFQEYYADPNYTVKKMMEVSSIHDIELIETASNEYNGRLFN